MKKNAILILTLTMLFAFSFQAAIGQESMSSDAQSLLDDMTRLKNKLDEGQVNFREGEWEANNLKWALSKEDREKFLKKSWLTDTERKKLAEGLDAIAKSAAKQGVSLKTKEEDPLSNPVVVFLLNDLARITDQVNKFDPSKHAFIVNPADGQWLMRAVSARERETWARDFFKDDAGAKPALWQKLDALAVSAAKKVPTFKPNSKNFANHNDTDETMMKKQLGDPTKIKIHKIGLAQADWDIQKNDLDIPQKRYKTGYIWGKDSRDDFAFCRLYQVNIIQDYSGGGKYGASYAVYLESWLAGCP